MRRYLISLTALAAVCLSTFTAAAAEKGPKSISLFNAKCLAGWEHFLVKDDVKMEDVWSVQDGILVCKGEPMGYLCTKKEFENYKLIVEWRWAPGKAAGNSGVLLRITGKPMALPKCVEAQLKSGDAGDIWAFQGFQVKGDDKRFREVNHPQLGKFMGLSKIKGNEKAPGEWNKYEITIDGDKLTLAVNGEKVNEASGCDLGAGKVGFQSEGGEIHFRTIELVPLGE
jgi:hypothetical protein